MPLDAESRALIDVLQSSSAPVETLTPEQARRASDERRARSAAPVEQVHAVTDTTAATGAGQRAVRIYRPSAADCAPVIVFFHGGGWVLCDLDSHDALCRSLANLTGSVIVSVDYRRAPESRYPAAVEDCYAATVWVAEHAGELHVDPARLAVMGDSSGGNLAAAVALMARDRALPTLALQVLLYPVLDDDFETASYRAFGAEHFLTRAAMEWYWQQYAPADRHHPYATPLRNADLTGLAPALILVAECDPLHDEGLAYAGRLTAAGVPTEVIDYAGGFHGFLSLAPVLHTGRSALAAVGAGVRAQLEPRRAGYP